MKTQGTRSIRNHQSPSALLEALEQRRLLSTYFVSTSGSDSAAGTTTAPWQTLQKAADTAHSGDTVVVRAGTYAGMVLNGSSYPGGVSFIAGEGAGAGNFRTSGVTVNSFSSRDSNHYALINIEVNAGGYTIDGFNVVDNGSATKAGIRVAASYNDKITDNQVSGAYTGIFASMANGIVIQGNLSHDATQQHGIYVSGTDGFTIKNNECYGNPFDGIHLNVADGTNLINTNGLVDGNLIHDNTLTGIDVAGASFVTFQNNVIYGNKTHGIVFQNSNQNPTPACHDNVIVNNTIDATGGNYALMFSDDANGNNGVNTTVFNNILLPGSSGSIGQEAGVDPTFKSSNNITSASGLFVNQAGHDYHLKAGAAAIDAGVGVFNGKRARAADIEGNPRPQGSTWDVGAYEFGAVVVARTVTAMVHGWLTLPNTLSFTFSQNVSASISLADISVKLVSTGASVPVSAVSYNSVTNTAKIHPRRCAGRRQLPCDALGERCKQCLGRKARRRCGPGLFFAGRRRQPRSNRRCEGPARAGDELAGQRQDLQPGRLQLRRRRQCGRPDDPARNWQKTLAAADCGIADFDDNSSTDQSIFSSCDAYPIAAIAAELGLHSLHPGWPPNRPPRVWFILFFLCITDKRRLGQIKTISSSPVTVLMSW